MWANVRVKARIHISDSTPNGLLPQGSTDYFSGSVSMNVMRTDEDGQPAGNRKQRRMAARLLKKRNK